MPIIQSAKKALRGSAKKRVFNLRRKRALDEIVKEVKNLTNSKKGKEIQAALSSAYKAIDKAAKAGTIKKGNADRKKSRLAAFVRKNS